MRSLSLVGSGLLLAALAGVPDAAFAERHTNVLLGRAPARSQGVLRAAALTDDRAAHDGGHWKSRLTAVFIDTSARVDYDLGAPRTIRAAWLQGDNNDVYRVELSLDGRTYTTLWDAARATGWGLQPRSTQGLDATGRYVRVRPLRGDGNFALSEIQLFTGGEGPLPAPKRSSATPLDDRLRDRILLFGLALLGLLLLPGRRRRWVAAAAVGLFGLGAFQLARGLWDAWPVEARGVALLRGTIAFVGAAAVARELFAPARWPACRPISTGVLALCAGLAGLAFYNLGHPQNFNPHTGRWAFAHYADLRQYYPTAKYFRELGYSGIYDADLAALAEPDSGFSRAALLRLPVRDLVTFAVVPANERPAEIAATRAQFTDERWADYRRDAAWFRSSMGERGYLDTLLDYGGNAPPLWMAIAHLLFARIPPSDAAFTLLGLIDLALFAGMFVAIQRSFGWRSMLICLLVFGANDFVMYGSNWSGATLRHDWLACLGFGVCALRQERWVLGGALLGLAAMIRAFPAFALIGIGLPALLRVSAQVLRTRRLPGLRALLVEERATFRIALGAAIAIASAAVLATLVLGPAVWGEWLDKVTSIEADPHPASVALRNLIGGSEHQARVLLARWPVFAAAIAFYLGAVLFLGRRARPEQAAVLGLCLVPVLLYPANYYLHFVFLVPLLAAGAPAPDAGAGRARDGSVFVIVLLMCAVQYFTTLEHDLALHFYYSTLTLFAMLTAVLVVLAFHDPDLRRWWTQP